MLYQPDPGPLNVDTVLGNYVQRELQKLSGLFQADPNQGLNIADYLPLAGGTLTGLLTTNGQIAFPATQNPSADANTLDDYEQGLWTPNLQFAGSSAGITYAQQHGFYTKIGDFVFASLNFVLTNAGAAAAGSAATISGLPFTSLSTPGSAAGGGSINTAAFVAIGGLVHGLVVANSAAVAIYHGTTTGSTTTTKANFANNTTLIMCLTYRTS